MGIKNWFKKTTVQGKIKNELGEVHGEKLSAGKVIIQIQELEPGKGEDQRRFRFNVVFKSLLSHQSMPIVLNEKETVNLMAILKESLEAKK